MTLLADPGDGACMLASVDGPREHHVGQGGRALGVGSEYDPHVVDLHIAAATHHQLAAAVVGDAGDLHAVEQADAVAVVGEEAVDGILLGVAHPRPTALLGQLGLLRYVHVLAIEEWGEGVERVPATACEQEDEAARGGVRGEGRAAGQGRGEGTTAHQLAQATSTQGAGRGGSARHQ